MDRAASTTGLVLYMADHAIASLYRNGRVPTTRDRDGSDAGYQDVDTVEVPMPTGASMRKIGVHGFELIARPPGRPGLDFYDHDYPEYAKFVCETVQAPSITTSAPPRARKANGASRPRRRHPHQRAVVPE